MIAGFVRFISILGAVSAVLSALCACGPGSQQNGMGIVQSGDIIFHESTSSQSEALKLATGSRYTHMGIVYIAEGSYYVYEAVSPVKLTPLKEWIARGKDGHYVLKRLKDASSLLDGQSLNRMKAAGEKYQGLEYDLYFEWSDDRIYCSELVWKIYNEALGVEIGELNQLQDFDLTSEPVRQKLSERYGENPPMNEPVISPVAMFESNMLETIHSSP